MFFKYGKWVGVLLSAALLFSGCGFDAAGLSSVAQESVSSGDLDAADDLTADGSDAGVSGSASDAGEVYSPGGSAEASDGGDAVSGEDAEDGSALDGSGSKNSASDAAGKNSAGKNTESASNADRASDSSAKDSALAKDSKRAAKKNSSDKKTSRAAKKKARRAASDAAADALTCTISIECTRLLSHMDSLKESKVDFVPEDGVILPATEVTFSEGESVYDILYRVCTDNKIHLEASYTPAYNAYYVEGINQLYEFDCGSLSGWMYFVNGESPNYGCSKVTAQPGDEIVWRYTCDSGRDLE